MKILLIHNYYQQPGGEDQVFQAEKELLESRGNQVIQYTIHNDQVASMSSIGLAKATLWNSSVYREIIELIKQEKPAVAHFHNTFPLISPAAYYAASSQSVPVIQTLHNYRLLCSNALFLRQGRVCEDCLNKILPWPAVLHACYRNDWLASAVTASMQVYHRFRKTWINLVDVYIALTDFLRKKMIQGGLPQSKIIVKPNFVQPDPGEKSTLGDYALFAGRLSHEKGIKTLLDAWKDLRGIPLKILGDGQQRETVVAQIAKDNLSEVDVLGWRSHSEVIDAMKSARFLVYPSETYETFSLAIAEGFACGLPAIASRLGASAEIVSDQRNGLLFNPGDPGDLTLKVSWAWTHPDEMRKMGQAGRLDYQQHYSADQNYQLLMNIYQAAINARTKRADLEVK